LPKIVVLASRPGGVLIAWTSSPNAIARPIGGDQHQAERQQRLI
jgi:hypothetical protein